MIFNVIDTMSMHVHKTSLITTSMSNNRMFMADDCVLLLLLGGWVSCLAHIIFSDMWISTRRETPYLVQSEAAHSDLEIKCLQNSLIKMKDSNYN